MTSAEAAFLDRLLSIHTAVEDEPEHAVAANPNIERHAAAVAALEAHLATPYPGQDRCGKHRRTWDRTACALRDDVRYYAAKV